MASFREIAFSFGSGELAPELYGRADLGKFKSGLALARNFEILPHGPAMSRPGFEFVHETQNSAAVSRLIPFSYNNTQSFAIEVGAGYFRWHAQGAVLLYSAPAAYNAGTTYNQGDTFSSAGVNYYVLSTVTGVAAPNATYYYVLPATLEYEIPNSYAAADLADIHYVQSSDVLTLAHPSYPTMELRRFGATNWQFTQVTFSPTLGAPFGTAVAGTPISHTYVVTANMPLGGRDYSRIVETQASASANASVDLNQAGASMVVTWTPTGAYNQTGYNVYKLLGGVYCYLGTSPSNTFTDDAAITAGANLSRHPPTGGYTAGATGVAATPNASTIVNPTATPTGTGTIPYSYVVTAVGADNDQSYPSGIATCNNNLATAGNSNLIVWPAVQKAIRYNIFKLSNGIFGYIGQAAGSSFVDNNITADLSNTPPLIDNTLLGGPGDYPAAVSYVEQRRAFGGTLNAPMNAWLTRTGTESDMTYTIPTRDDNRISFRVASREASGIRHLVPLADTLLLTATCEWRMTGNNGPVSPTNIMLKPQSYIGASNVTPIVVGNILLFAAARGGHLREMSYTWQTQAYQANDISILAPHLFDFLTIKDMAMSKGPYPIVWCVSSNGTLLGLTYVPEQEVSAWHHHDSLNGSFEAICTISEIPAGEVTAQDMLYAIVKRTINGVTKRYVERLHSRYFSTLSDAFFVDCGATYSGAPATSVSGLSWLEGQTVSILADGAVCPQQVVTGGAITVPTAASKITVGIPITADIQTLPLYSQLDAAMGQGRPKNVDKVWLRVNRSSGIAVGPDFTHLTPYAQRTTEPFGSPPNLISDEIEIVLTPSWASSGQVCVRQSDPLPLTITSMTVKGVAGG